VARLGGTVEDLQRLKGQLATEAQHVAELQARLTGIVGNTDFEGPWADRFRQDWNGQYKQALNNLSQVLNELGSEVQRRTDALINVTR
jgi:uncharacterized protein YukE